MLADFREALDAMAFKGRILLEAGRFWCALRQLCDRVVDTKQNQGQNYCIVDGGINHVNYYGRSHGHENPGHPLPSPPLSPAC